MNAPYWPYIVLRLSEAVLQQAGFDLLYEGQWRPSRVNDLWVRVDQANPSIPLQRNVHVAHKKHISSKERQVSWNQDGSRHDLHSFEIGFKGIEKAKAVARTALGLPSEFILEHIKRKAETLIFLIESYSPFPSDAVLLSESELV